MKQCDHHRKKAIPSVILNFWPVGIVLMNFQLFNVAGFNFTVGTLVYLLLSTYLGLVHQLKVKLRDILIAHGLVFLSLALGFWASDVTEYFKSFGQLYIMLLFIILVSSIHFRELVFLPYSVKIFFYVAIVAGAYLILQFILMNFFGDYSLLNPFGKFTFTAPGSEPYSVSPLASIKRPNAFFYEPSVAGGFFTFSLAIALSSPFTSNRLRRLTILICSAATVLTFSLSGIFNLFIIFLLSVYISSNKKRGTLLLWSILGVTIAIFLLTGWGYLLLDRLLNINIEGTSAYYRVVAPTKLLADSLKEFPFGHPLGQVEYIETKEYMVNWEFGSNTNIDNSFFFASYYFGLFGALGSMAIFGLLLRSVLLRRQSAIMLMALLLLLGQTGALWSPNTVLIIGFSIIMIKYLEKYQPSYNKDTPLSPRS